MPEIKLEIKYSTKDITGHCVQCQAEQELYTCLRNLLMEEQSDKEVEKKYEMLVTFLQSPDLIKMRIESEKYLAEGKRVFLVIKSVDGKTKYELEVNKNNGGI
jgi:hypothetical protein